MINTTAQNLLLPLTDMQWSRRWSSGRLASRNDRVVDAGGALIETHCRRRTLRGEIARKTADWGIFVKSVEIRDVAIPVALQDAMSRQAQAEREKQARIILGSAEAAIVGVEAAMTYADHPTALQLRAMNIIYETTKERGATILIPTSMVDSMNPVVALALAGQQTAPQKTSGPLPLSANEGKERVAAPQTAGTQRLS
jgi:SPFH domain / Band 7 family